MFSNSCFRIESSSHLFVSIFPGGIINAEAVLVLNEITLKQVHYNKDGKEKI